MRNGAMTPLAWLVLTGALAAALGVTGDAGVTSHPGAADHPASPDRNTPAVGDATGDEAEGLCPRGCEMCVTDDLRRYFCGGQQLKYMDDSRGSFMELVCEEAPLNCSAVPPLPRRRRGPLQRVEVTACSLPPSLPLTCATGGERTQALSFSEFRSALTEENVRGLDAGDLFLSCQPGAVREVPVRALRALPRLRSLRLLQGSALALRGDMFLGSPPLAYLEISMSGLGDVPANAFRGLEALQNLSLWGNNITRLSEDAFNGLQSLEKLVLNDNPLEGVEAGALSRAPRLRTVLLERVRLAALHEGTFRGLAHLQQVRVSSRAALRVGARAFSALPALTALAVTHSRVASLPPDLFLGSGALRDLALDNNKLAALPGALFAGLRALRRLQLAHNELAQLPADLLLPLADLRDLDLDHNRIRALPPYVFSGLGKLTSVSLAHNRLVSVSPLSFSGAASLRHLSLSHNLLAWPPSEYEESSPFQMLLKLQTLDLSHNAIGTVYSDWRYILLQLERLDLSYNNLTALSQADVQFVGRCAVDLSHNRIAAVEPRAPWAALDSSPPAARLTLDHNPFDCDCRLYDFLTQVQAGAAKYLVERAACAAPAALAGRALRRVDAADVTCPMRDVAAGCSCRIRPASDAAECLCNGTQVPGIGEAGVSQMALRVTRAPTAEELRHLAEHVRVLNLSSLGLAAVPDVPASVAELDLTGNEIAAVPRRLWDRPLRLRLAGNPLACECSTTEDVLLLKRHAARVDYERVRCADGTPLRQKDARALCDLLKSSVAASLAALALVLLALAAALLYRYRLELQVFLYGRGWCLRLLPKEDVDFGKKYDVFVSFASEDERFVREEILPRLERRYVLHVQDRDWVVGNTIPGEIHRSVAESRRTLILLTRRLRGSMWAGEGFRAAHAQAARDRRRRAVVVLRGLRRRDLDAETAALLSLCTLLDYDEPMFWDKLRYALPRKDSYRCPEVDGAARPEALDLWKGRGLDVVLNDEGKLVNKGYVKDVA